LFILIYKLLSNRSNIQKEQNNMRCFQIVALNLLFTAFLVAAASAQEEEKPDAADKTNNRESVSKDSRSKGDVDALLQKLRKSNEKVFERCLENCGKSKDTVKEKPRPEYPAEAKARRVSGKVVVRVVIDEQGDVMAVQAVGGPIVLQDSAVAAARKARFRPTQLSGTTVKVSGTITYNFVAQ
jgi:TonB family protein